MITIDRLLQQTDIRVGDTDGQPDLFALLDALSRAEVQIGEAIDAQDGALSDADLERVVILPQLHDGRSITGLRIGRDPDSLTFRLTLLAGGDR